MLATVQPGAYAMQVLVVNQANSFMKAAWRDEAMLCLHAKYGFYEDASWSSKCAQNLYYK